MARHDKARVLFFRSLNSTDYQNKKYTLVRNKFEFMTSTRVDSKQNYSTKINNALSGILHNTNLLFLAIVITKRPIRYL